MRDLNSDIFMGFNYGKLCVLMLLLFLSICISFALEIEDGALFVNAELILIACSFHYVSFYTSCVTKNYCINI